MRVITNNDIKTSQRLSKLWEKKRKVLELTQNDVADSLGITQSAISHQLHARMALTTDLVLAWAKVLQADPADIDPNVGKKIAIIKNEPRTAIRIYILGTTAQGKPTQTSVETFSAPHLGCYGIEVTEPIGDEFSVGDVLIIDPAKSPRKGSRVLIKLTDTILVGKIASKEEHKITLRLDGGSEQTILTSDTWYTHSIVGVEYAEA